MEAVSVSAYRLLAVRLRRHNHHLGSRMVRTLDLDRPSQTRELLDALPVLLAQGIWLVLLTLMIRLLALEDHRSSALKGIANVVVFKTYNARVDNSVCRIQGSNGEFPSLPFPITSLTKFLATVKAARAFAHRCLSIIYLAFFLPLRFFPSSS